MQQGKQDGASVGTMPGQRPQTLPRHCADACKLPPLRHYQSLTRHDLMTYHVHVTCTAVTPLTLDQGHRGEKDYISSGSMYGRISRPYQVY